jgi:hypothetical protein
LTTGQLLAALALPDSWEVIREHASQVREAAGYGTPLHSAMTRLEAVSEEIVRLFTEQGAP